MQRGAGPVVSSGPDFTLYSMSTSLLQLHQDWSGTPGETCQCSVVLLELGYKVMDQRNRFIVHCGVCLACEPTPPSPLWVSLFHYHIPISLTVIARYWQG